MCGAGGCGADVGRFMGADGCGVMYGGRYGADTGQFMGRFVGAHGWIWGRYGTIYGGR